jgi:cell division GTPase FtsZ
MMMPGRGIEFIVANTDGKPAHVARAHCRNSAEVNGLGAGANLSSIRRRSRTDKIIGLEGADMVFVTTAWAAARRA